MNFVKIKISVASLIMALLLVTVMLPIQAFAMDQSAQDTENGSVDLEVELQIQGDKPSEDATFTFVLEAKDDAPVPASTNVSINGAGTANFGDIEFTHSGVYHYDVYEQNDGIENYTYDDSVYSVDIYVTYDNNGNMVENIVAYSDDEKQSGDKEAEITFVNEYTEDTPIEDEPENGNSSDTPDSLKISKTSNTGDYPYTGDYSNMYQWIAILLIAIIGLICCVWYLNVTKKHGKNDDEL